MKETILVTGASNTIGRELVRYLLSKNVCVRIAVHTQDKADEFINCGCPIVTFDYQNTSTFKDAFEGINGFFLSAPLQHPRLDELILPAIETAKQMNVKNIVSLGEFGLEVDRDSPLSILEKVVQSCGLQYTIFRSNLLMQNIVQIAKTTIPKLHQIHLPSGNARISFVDARDLAEAAGIALMDPPCRNKVYNITGSEALNHYEVAAILSKVIGNTISYVSITHNEMLRNLLNDNWSEGAALLMVGLYEIARNGWCELITEDLSMILDREPIRFEQFAWDYKDFWKANG